MLAPNAGSGSPANKVVPTGASETAQQTPGAAQSGIKLINQFTVEPGATTTVPAISLSASSTMGTVSGTVSGGAVSLPATLRALQAVGTVPNVEVAGKNTDGAGAYTMSLPRATPLLSSYSATALTFTPSGSSGVYTMEAIPASGTPKTTSVDIAGGNATADFVFP